MTAFVVMLVLALTGGDGTQERPRVPDDSIELTLVGCLKGRAFTTVTQRDARVERGPDVGVRTFRLNGKRDVMDEVKRRNRQLVEVVGVVKRSALDEKGVTAGRVAITGGSPVAGGGRVPTGIDNVAVMDVTSVRQRATSCAVN